MNNLKKLENIKLHEVFNYIAPEYSNSIKLGLSLKDRVMTDEINCKEIIEVKADYINLLSKMNYNFGNNNEKFIISYLIKQKNYIDLIEILKITYPFSLLPIYDLYKYCRSVCKVPILKVELNNINITKKKINKICDKYEDKKITFVNKTTNLIF